MLIEKNMHITSWFSCPVNGLKSLLAEGAWRLSVLSELDVYEVLVLGGHG